MIPRTRPDLFLTTSSFSKQGMYSRQQLEIGWKVRAGAFSDSHFLTEEFKPGLEGPVADTRDTGKTVGLFLDKPLFGGDVVVGVGLCDCVLVGAFAKATEEAFHGVSLLFEEVELAVELIALGFEVDFGLVELGGFVLLHFLKGVI